MNQNTASGNVNLRVQLDGDGTASLALLHRVTALMDGGNLRLFSAGKHHQLISYRDAAAFDLALEAAEGMIRTADTLHRHGKAGLCRIFLDVDAFQVGKQGLALIPEGALRGHRDVVSLGGGDRNHGGGLVLKLGKKNLDVADNLVEFALFVVD